MANSTPIYSRLLHCLYDEQASIKNHGHHYSIFRGIDCRDIELKPTALPRVHDFAVLWDDDHDQRIIPVLEEVLMSGLLPGIQFVGEHKGELTILLAARTYWAIADMEAYKQRVTRLSKASGDFWSVRVGMYDHSPGNLRTGHQCDFEEIIGSSAEETHAYLFTIDTTWKLGTKEWQGIETSESATQPATFFSPSERYRMRPELTKFVTVPPWGSPAMPAPPRAGT